MTNRRPLIATYMDASRPHRVLYIGMTANLYERAGQHRTGAFRGFASRHGCGMLVWCQQHEFVTAAIRREKALKRWNRVWKLELIERTDPDWIDLFPSLCGWAPDPRVKPVDDGEGSVAAFLASLDGTGDA